MIVWGCFREGCYQSKAQSQLAVVGQKQTVIALCFCALDKHVDANLIRIDAINLYSSNNALGIEAYASERSDIDMALV